MSEPTYLGNEALLQEESVGFLAPTKFSPLDVLPTLEWAAQTAKGRTPVMSGFASPLERDVLHFLLRGTCPIIVVLARRMYAKLPAAWEKPIAEGRMLVVSVSNLKRQSCNSAVERNRYVIYHAAKVVMPAEPPWGSRLLLLFDILRLRDGVLLLREENAPQQEP